MDETQTQAPAVSALMSDLRRLSKLRKMPGAAAFDSLKRAAESLETTTAEALNLLGAIAGNIEQDCEKQSANDPAATPLTDHVKNLRAEIERERKLYEQGVANLKTALTEFQDDAKSAPAPDAERKDPITGLPERQAAEAAIHRAIQEQRHLFVAVFVIERLGMINTRFGYSVGNQVFHLYSKHLAQSLQQHDELYRWTGPGFIALIERGGDEAAARSDVLAISSKRFSRMIDAGSRSVLLSIGTTSTLFSVKGASAESLVESIEEFTRTAT